jgi:hypothetical protein
MYNFLSILNLVLAIGTVSVALWPIDLASAGPSASRVRRKEIVNAARGGFLRQHYPV